MIDTWVDNLVYEADSQSLETLFIQRKLPPSLPEYLGPWKMLMEKILSHGTWARSSVLPEEAIWFFYIWLMDCWRTEWNMGKRSLILICGFYSAWEELIKPLYNMPDYPKPLADVYIFPWLGSLFVPDLAPYCTILNDSWLGPEGVLLTVVGNQAPLVALLHTTTVVFVVKFSCSEFENTNLQKRCKPSAQRITRT